MNENPLSRAVEDAGSLPEARSYVMPVGSVRRAVRRRRALRTGGVAALAVLVVGGAAGGVNAGLGAWRGGPPADGSSLAAVGDWAGQFARCGQPMGSGVQLVLPDVPSYGDSSALQGAALRVDGATTSMPADGEWAGTLTLAGQGLDGREGWTWGTDLTVFDDSNTVVGVQTAAQVPDAEGIDEWLAGAAPSFALEPFPLVSDVSLGLASCEQYLTGGGPSELAPGDYHLMITQTASVLDADGTRHDLRRSTAASLTITAGDPVAGPTLESATACGASDDQLAKLADPELNPHAFAVEAEFAGEAHVGQRVPVGYTLDLGEWTVGEARAVLTSDGAIVGDVDYSFTPLANGASQVESGPPQDCAARAAAKSEPEDGFPLAAGHYELWLGLNLSRGGEHALMAAGPWPLTLHPRPTPGEQSDIDTARWDTAFAQRDALFPCGQVPDADALAVALGYSDAQRRTTPVAISSVDVPAGYPSPSWSDWSATLRPFEADEVEVDVLVGPHFAFVGPDGVQGFTAPVVETVTHGVVGADGWTSPGAPASLVGCGPDGTAAASWAEEGLPAGTYQAYPLVSVVVTQVTSNGSTSQPDYTDPTAGVVLLVGPPQPVSFAGP